MSMDAAPTITEFLLARIAEDEEEAARMGCTEYYDGGWSNEHEVHVRKECEAKRAIIDTVTPYLDGNPRNRTGEILTHLAAVYSDHPDYRQEWALHGAR